MKLNWFAVLNLFVDENMEIWIHVICRGDIIISYTIYFTYIYNCQNAHIHSITGIYILLADVTVERAVIQDDLDSKGVWCYKSTNKFKAQVYCKESHRHSQI